MQPSTNAPLKVLTPQFAERLRTFNEASRTLQRMGIRLHRIEPTENRLTISPEGGRLLEKMRLVAGFQRHGSAGSTRYIAQFQGVEVTWSEPISYRDYAPRDLSFH
ncbi:hypothetical protein [Pseudomonas citronellolis]|uniref:hypothetical protein n=1 Tax=Pseudomonas citronellolis TaxID=53408 RepID=UPI00209FDCE1|nr:hypothetical protein [Pseudomonas citronellolis]MCP1606433.1 hypothetical protein [Pseudomonas citronellolis]MCP1657139.1 hypothetical protein [Pseudomonas citronellolis]MCP1724128.1 hypothetical protein [Pseudomonas citronellolis]